MRDKDTQVEPGSTIVGPTKKDLSRRNFLQTAAAAGVVAATIPLAGIAQTGPAHRPSGTKSPEEEILSRYGSEFGHLSEIG